MLTVFLNLGMFSCSPQSNNEDNGPTAIEKEDCCGNGGNIPPPTGG